MPARRITVAETRLFVRQAERVWTDAEREEFVDFVAGNPEAGDLIPKTGGVRKSSMERGRLRQAGWRAGDLLSKPSRNAKSLHYAQLYAGLLPKNHPLNSTKPITLYVKHNAC